VMLGDWEFIDENWTPEHDWSPPIELDVEEYFEKSPGLTSFSRG